MSGRQLHVKVVSPERVVLETEAEALFLPGALGQLGILPGHAALITALRTGVLEVRGQKAMRRMLVLGGFAEVREDVVTVLADGAELPEDIDLGTALAEREAAAQALATATPETLPALRTRLDAAEARLAVVRS